MTLTQILAIAFLASVIASPFIGAWLHRRRTRSEFQGLLARETEARKERLAKLVVLADQYDVAPTAKERTLIFKKATKLGFTDSGNETDYRAFMDSDEGPRAA